METLNMNQNPISINMRYNEADKFYCIEYIRNSDGSVIANMKDEKLSYLEMNSIQPVHILHHLGFITKTQKDSILKEIQIWFRDFDEFE